MTVIRNAMLGVAMVVSFAGIARAETLEVKIPFAFTVGGTQLPAGAYRILRSSEASSSILLIEGEHGNRTEMFIQTTPLQGVSPVHEPALIFVPGETANRLTAVWGSGSTGYEVSGTRRHSRQLGQIVVRAGKTS